MKHFQLYLWLWRLWWWLWLVFITDIDLFLHLTCQLEVASECMRRQCVRKRDNDERTMIIQILFLHQTKVRFGKLFEETAKMACLEKSFSEKNIYSHAAEEEWRTEEKCAMFHGLNLFVAPFYSANDTYYENLRLAKRETKARTINDRGLIEPVLLFCVLIFFNFIETVHCCAKRRKILLN